MKYKWVETTYHLLHAYEALSLEFRRKNEPKEAFAPDIEAGPLAARSSMHHGNYGYTFALLNLNAAIIEGTMRSLLSEIVSEDIEKRTAEGIANRQTERTAQENLLIKFYVDLDSSGGWDKLKEQYSLYRGISIDKSLKADTRDAISTLFLLRNIFAHGTAFIHPSEKVPDDLRDEPIFKWQSRVQRATVYLEKHFGHKDVFDNLGEYHLAKHFYDQTKAFFEEVLPVINFPSKRIEKTVSVLKRASWGYRNLP